MKPPAAARSEPAKDPDMRDPASRDRAHALAERLDSL
jgi:hypothetical protein